MEQRKINAGAKLGDGDGMGLKDLYYGMEDKYYEIIDRISETIPINKLIEPIDKIVPSFIVLIGLIVFLVLLGIALMYSGGIGEEKELSFKVVNEQGQAIANTEIKVLFNENTNTLTTDAFGRTDKILVPLNSMVSYEVDKTGYEKNTDQFKFTEEKTHEITLIKEEIKGTTRTIRLYDSANRNELISDRSYTIYFSCSNPKATPPSTITISNGRGEVMEPENCGALTAEVAGNHSETTSHELDESSNAIYLDSMISNYTLTVFVENEDGIGLKDDIRVRVYAVYDSNPNPVFADSSLTSYGEAEFDLEAGEYLIKASDDSGEYFEASKNLYDFTEDASIRITMERVGPEGGKITIKAIDEDTELELPDTTVTLYDADGLVEKRTTDENGVAEFYVRDKDGYYEAVLDNELYLVKRATDLTVGTHTVELEKYTGSNAGILKVRAVTVDSGKEKPVRNAKIALYSVEDTEVFLTGLSEKITDENGSAKFNRVENGRYKAFAYKGTSSGWSDEIQYDKRNAEEIELTAAMIIPEGLINLRIVDLEGNSIPFATVSFFEEGTVKKLNSYKTDADGNISFATKADKKVYFTVEKEEYMNYYSLSYPIFGNEIVHKTVEMIPEKRMENPEVNLVGLFVGEELAEASSLERAQEYTARIQFIVPKGKNYGTAGIHFRVGSDIFMENDYLLIKKVNAANAITKKFTMFDSDNLNDSKKSFTEGDAKWFNSNWFLPKPGVYNIEAVIFVKENALVGQELKLRFRAYGKNGKIERDPQDVEVSSSEELNAATKEKTYTLGTNVLCSEKFCFTARIKDLEEDLIESVTNSSYATNILQKYELWFDVMNNDSSRKHYDARIQLKNENEMLNFLDYTIKNADALTRTGFADNPKTEWIDLGDFNPNTHVTGTVEFITQESEPGSILIQIVSSQEIVFEKQIQLEVKAPKTFLLEIDPKIIPSVTSNTVEFTVLNEETGIEVENAEIKVFDRFEDLIAGPELTNKKGKALMEIPGQAPDTKLKARVSKREYEVLEQEMQVNEEIVEITPERIGMTLNTQKKTEDIFGLKIKNLLEFDLELTSIKFTGNARGLLNLDEMHAWVETNHGNKKIPSKLFEEIEVKAILSDYAITRAERDTIDLELELEFSNGEAVWTEEIPARISVGVGGEVDDPNCLSLETKEWKTGTEGQKVSVDFSIENSCTIEGNPVNLKDLEAKVNWKTNHIGTYTLTFKDTPIELRSAYYRKLTDLIENGSSTAVLAFEPNGGVNGDAIAEIEVRARNELEGKDEYISDSISTEIKIINLEDCIKVSPTELKIKKGETAVFKVETLGCGSTVDFTIDSEIKVSNTRFTLGSQASQEISVDSMGEYSGRFITSIEAKGLSLQTKTEIINVYTTIFEDSCIELSRYEFDIYDDPAQMYDGYDTAQLYNYCPEKPVAITIDMQDFSLAMREAFLPAIMAFGGAMVFGGDDGACEDGDTKNCKINNCPGIKTCVNQKWGACVDVPGDNCPKENVGGGGSQGSPGPPGGRTDEDDTGDNDDSGDEEEKGPGTLSKIGKGIGGTGKAIGKGIWKGIKGIGGLFGGGDNADDGGDFVDDTTETTDEAPPVYASEKTEIVSPTGFFDLSSIGNILGLGNLLPSIFGGVSAFQAFGLTFVGATLWNYFDAETLELNTIADDIVLMNVKLLDGIKYTEEKIEVIDEDITMSIDGPFSCFDSFTGETIECWDVVFVNEKGIIQEDEHTPIMKIMKTESVEKFWRKEYDLDYFNENKGFFEKLFKGADLDLEKPLEELVEERNEINQYNRLQFNSFKYDENITGEQAYGSCRLGEMNGETGVNALPKIKLDWRWNKIDADECDEGNNNYIYCDATQFSIELLKKIIELTDLLETEQLICSGNCNTINLSSLIQKTEEERGTVANKEKLTELVGFRSYLMKDGYSKDFQEDFHDYAVNISFFDAPTEYYSTEEDTGIGKYFKDQDLFDFDYDGAPNQPLSSPGLYKVVIEIEYNNNSWRLFNGTTPDAKITIHLNRLKTAQPDSPLYYLPFDGEIGLNTRNGRTNYGIDYENIVGDPIRINDTERAIKTTPIPVATPIQTLKTYYEKDFKKTNVDQRGKIMEFQRTANSTSLIYSPSKATPVLLETRRSSETAQESEYVFYSVTVDGQAQNVGSNGLTKWSGIEPNCKDFEDKSSLKYWETFDLHGLSDEAKAGAITIENKALAYGWTWDNPIRTGKFWLETLVFTPLDSVSKMELISSSNKALIYTPLDAATIELGSTLPGFVELNGVMSTKITSLQKILDLVKSEDVCVGGGDNSAYAYFFWNPEKVDDSINPVKESLDVEQECILG